ncbi:MAG TPA: RNA polymerase sigma factor [Actinomycetota bacterium]|nr:RNA polymerase sigma factor [Actinomycetota bacterium]
MELDDVFRAHQRSVYAYLLRTVGDERTAEELTQEAFYRACVAALRFRGESSVRTWLFGIARKVLLEHLRHRARVEPSADPGPAAAEHVEHEDRVDLERAFARLSIDDREVLMLVDVLGFEPREAAGTLEIDPGALRVRLHRARRRLRDAYTGGASG